MTPRQTDRLVLEAVRRHEPATLRTLTLLIGRDHPGLVSDLAAAILVTRARSYVVPEHDASR
jgi:hypothetical protein